MLRNRLLSAVILIGSVLFMVSMDGAFPLFSSPGLWLIPVLAFFVAGTAFEFSGLVAHRYPVHRGRTVLLSLGIVLIASFPIFYVAVQGSPYPPSCPIGILGWVVVGMMSAIGLTGVAALQNFSQGKPTTLECWALETLIPLYVGGFGAFWVAIRLSAEPMNALANLVGILTVVKVSDAAAYFTGRLCGRTKMCPRISPKKTIEGAVGGLAGAVVVSVVYFSWFLPEWWIERAQPLAWWGPILLAIALGVVGIIGDLLESVVKRSVEAKDSGQLFPGLGGIWDVTDSILPTAAVGYLGILAHWI